MKCPHCDSENLSDHAKNPPRWICNDCTRTTRRPVMGSNWPDTKLTKQTFVITWAQNATPVFGPFLKSIKTYLKKNDAQLLVVAGRYKNATSVWTKQQETDEWWHEALEPYMCGNETQLDRNLTLLADLPIQPTAVNPLSGSVKTQSGALSCIVGHPQIAQETVATPQSKLAKIVMTTGAITKPNYSKSRAGKQGEFHHEYGAVVVEIDGPRFHVRHIIADGHGKFYDFDKLYDGNKVTKGHRAACFVSGDFHAKFLDQQVKQAWWTGKHSLLKLIKPKVQVFHDFFDGYFGSHHHNHDPFLIAKKHFNGDNDGMSEVRQSISELIDCLICDKNYITKSNHDEHVDRWLKETDWRKDPQNAEFYLETSLEWIRSIKAGNSFDPVKYWVERATNKATFLCRSDIVKVKDHIVSYHGDKGPNGSRGSRKSMNNIGAKTIIGHSHSAGREKGCIQVGLSAIYGLEYALGAPSSWMHTAAIEYANGKVALINCIDGHYRKR